MDDEEELARALAEFGIRFSDMDRNVPDDAVGPRWDETEELGDLE